MANYREIVTKAVVSKGKKMFRSMHEVEVGNASTILGCWVLNHQYQGTWQGNDIVLDGSYDVNIWYSSDGDTKTDVVCEKNSYHEVIHMRDREEGSGEEIIVRSLKQPTCTNVNIHDGKISYTIEKELGIELVGDVKVKVETDDVEDEWDEIVEEDKKVDSQIGDLNENFMEDVV